MARLARPAWQSLPQLVVNLWTTWRPPCRPEMPELARAQLAHSGDVRFVFVNQGEAPGDIRVSLQIQASGWGPSCSTGPAGWQRRPARQACQPRCFRCAQRAGRAARLGQMSAATFAQALEALR
jgi:thiol-disulfide isomerase/thioredoxin